MNQTLSYYSKKELQIVVIADTRFPDVLSSLLVALCATDCELKVLYIVFTLGNIKYN